MQPGEFVRRAETEDTGALAELEATGRAAITTSRGGAAWLATHPCLGAAGWQVRLADRGWVTMVAGLDGVVLGAATMRLPLGHPRAAAEISYIYVHPEARELGLGSSLLTELIAVARAAGATEIDATALPGDRETKNMFERAGLVARLLVVNRRLQP